jgi:hypothetical protein
MKGPTMKSIQIMLFTLLGHRLEREHGWCGEIVFYTSKSPPKPNNEYSRRSRGGRPRRVLGRPAHRPQCTHTAPYQVIVQRG